MNWKKFKPTYELFRDTFIAFSVNKIPRLGAALAFYTVFAIAPLFLIALAIAGVWVGEAQARHELFGQLSGLVGEQGGQALQAMITSAAKPKNGTWATSVAIITLVIGSTTVFVQLQDALNSVWNVRRKGGGIWHLVKDRLLSFAMVIGIGFLLLVSLILNALLSALGNYMSHFLPGEHTILQIINFLISLGIITLLFAFIFKILPDVKITWRDVWLGSLITAVLFNVGKFALGFYLGRSTFASAYGAAGSLIIVLLWVYYSAQILLFGAKYTQLYANRHGSHFQPIGGAEIIPPETSPMRKKKRDGK
jgi:membrane protein